MFDFIYPFSIFVIGSIMLYFGSDFLIDNASLLAKKINIPSIFIGVTIIAFGTSLPELVVSMKAAYYELPELIIGNIIGSNISNICLILGLILILFKFEINDFLNVQKNIISLLLIYYSSL